MGHVSSVGLVSLVNIVLPEDLANLVFLSSAGLANFPVYAATVNNRA